MGLGQGRRLSELLEELGQVAEGVITTRTAWELAQSESVDMPITEQMYRLMYEDKPVQQVVRDLLGRERKAERGYRGLNQLSFDPKLSHNQIAC